MDAINLANGTLDGTVIYVTVNVDSLGGSQVAIQEISAGTDNTVVFWDTDGDGDADEAIALLNTPHVLLGADDII